MDDTFPIGSNSPAFRRATAYLAGLVEACVKKEETRLPSLKAMSAGCGVSLMTMVKAVRSLRSRGIVAAVGKGGYIVTGVQPSLSRPPDVMRAPAARVTRADRVRDELARDILTGVFDPDDSLPLYKVMARRYGTSISR